MNKHKILKVINDLSNNAMFAISLTSKELFHTNLWAWMLRKYPQVFTPVFYPEYNGQDKIEVLREYKNTDLFLKIGDKSIIIENKLKSLPDKNQLERYNKKFLNTVDKTILVSYFSPLFTSGYDSLLSYDYLFEKMKECFEATKSTIIENTDSTLIQCYLEFLNLLNQLLHSVDFDSNNKIGELWAVIKDKEIQEKLKAINFAKTFEKAFLIKLTRWILCDFLNYEAIDTINIGCGRDLKVYSDMLFYFPGAWDKDESKRQDLCYLGISLWENEYRYYAGLHKNQCGITNPKNGRMDRDNKRAGFKYLSDNYDWFFEQENFGKWNGYSYESEMYLYKKLDVSKYSVKELSQKVIHDLELIYFYIEPMRNKYVTIK